MGTFLHVVELSYEWGIFGFLSCMCLTHTFHVFQLGYLRINILTRLVVIRSLIYYCHMTVFGSVLMENVWAVPNESCGWTLKAIKNPSLRVGHRNWSCTIWFFFFCNCMDVLGLLVSMSNCCSLSKVHCEQTWSKSNDGVKFIGIADQINQVPTLFLTWLLLVCFSLSFVMMMKKNI